MVKHIISRKSCKDIIIKVNIDYENENNNTNINNNNCNDKKKKQTHKRKNKQPPPPTEEEALNQAYGTPGLDTSYIKPPRRSAMVRDTIRTAPVTIPVMTDNMMASINNTPPTAPTAPINIHHYPIDLAGLTQTIYDIGMQQHTYTNVATPMQPPATPARPAPPLLPTSQPSTPQQPVFSPITPAAAVGRPIIDPLFMEENKIKELFEPFKLSKDGEDILTVNYLLEKDK